MFRRLAFLSLICVVVWFSLRQLEAQNQLPTVPGGSPAQVPLLASPEVQQRVLEVYGRNQEKLFENPDVLGVLPAAHEGKVLIETDRPEMVPKEVEGIPVKIAIIEVLPPPPGVIILKPGGVREHLKDAEECPEGFVEHKRRRWRFCQVPGAPEPFPLDITRPPPPPIAGIPYDKARAILQRHHEFFKRLPGVRAFGLSKNGIGVETTQPELLPKEVEGLPVFPEPVRIRTEAHHTRNAPAIRPVHGGIGIDDTSWPCDPVTHLPAGLGGTLGGVVLADGKPWGVTVAHLLYGCELTPPTCHPCDLPDWCPPNAVLYLNQYPHYQGPTIAQPYLPCPVSSSATIGRASRYTRVVGQTTTTDLAAFFLDNDTIEGNGSLIVDRRLHDASGGAPFKGTLAPPPMVGDNVLIVSASSDQAGQHIISANVSDTGKFVSIDYRFDSCWYGQYIYGEDQLEYGTTTPLLGGNSGALVFNATGDILSIVRWKVGPVNNVYYGGGSKISKVQAVLGYDAWYGTETVKDNTIGVFRPSAAAWIIDNGNGKYDGPGPCGPGVPTVTTDPCFNYGMGTDVPLTGDWDGINAQGLPSNDFTVGVYRTTTDPTIFLLSNTNSPPSTAISITAGPPSFNYRPVAGKWMENSNGTAISTGKTKVGVFRPSTGLWVLDSGNYTVDACGVDYCFSLYAGMYQANDIPIAGDWNNDGVVTIGLFRRGTGSAPDYFFLSNVNPFEARNNGTIYLWDRTVAGGPGSNGGVPVVGDWTGTNQAFALTGWPRMGYFSRVRLVGIWTMEISPLRAVPKISAMGLVQ